MDIVFYRPKRLVYYLVLVSLAVIGMFGPLVGRQLLTEQALVHAHIIGWHIVAVMEEILDC